MSCTSFSKRQLGSYLGEWEEVGGGVGGEGLEDRFDNDMKKIVMG